MTVKVTLEFDSAAAAALALNLLDQAARNPVQEAPVQEAPVQEAPAKAKKTKAENPNKVPEGPAVVAEKPAEKAPVQEAAPTEPGAFDYAVLQKAVFTLASKSRDAAAAVASEFGVKTFKDLDADQWPAAYTAVQAKIAELEA